MGFELELDKLDGRRVGAWTLSARVKREGIAPHRVSIAATRAGERCDLLVGRTNPGTAWRWPWLEARYRPCLGEGRERRAIAGPDQEALFRELRTVLTPGSYVMLSCDGHPETARALGVAVPPAATPLGHLLFTAGARWFKVWYYPEGWREGNEKVQGNVPPHEAHARKAEAALHEELEAFLASPLADAFPGCVGRAEAVIEATKPSRKD